MRIIEPAQLKQLKHRKPLKKAFKPMLIAVFLGLVSGFGLLLASASPLPNTVASLEKLDISTLTQEVLPWPGTGQAAIGASGYNILATSGAQTKSPIASVAKVMTALAILREKPLLPGNKGPMITIDGQDVELYNKYIDLGGSVTPVNYGQEISQYDAMQSLLLPSSNNMAVTLSRWAFGSENEYVQYANKFAASLGLKNTTIADASGFSPQTVSSASDLVLLGQAALKNPLIAEIVSQAKATLPIAGEVKNTNWLLGLYGINGIKTGHTNEAGGCLLFSAPLEVDGKKTTVIGAVMGAPDLEAAGKAAVPLLIAAKTNFKTVNVVTKGQRLGSYKTFWGGSADVVAKEDLSMLVWKGSALSNKLILQSLSGSAAKNQTVGELKVTSGDMTASIPAILKDKLPGPTLFWRLAHLF